MAPERKVDPRDPSRREWRRAGLPSCPPPEPGWEPVYIRYSLPPPAELGSYNHATGTPEGGTSVFQGYRTRANTFLINLQESIPLAICYTRMSRLRQPFLATGDVVGTGAAGESLLRVSSLELAPLPEGREIRPTIELPQWFTDRVLYVLRLEKMLGVKI
jgi:hypothetical protein